MSISIQEVAVLMDGGSDTMLCSIQALIIQNIFMTRYDMSYIEVSQACGSGLPAYRVVVLSSDRLYHRLLAESESHFKGHIFVTK